jgi:hypothetical protein
MKQLLPGIFAIFTCLSAGSQGLAVNNNAQAPNASAILDVSSNNKGLLIPRLSTAERNNIQQPATALLIYNTELKQFQVNIGSPATPSWQAIVGVSVQQPSKDVWQTSGNKQLPDSAFVGNTDNKALAFRTNNVLRLYIDSAESRIGIATSKPRSSLDINTTDAMIVPVGTTEQRPPTPVVGMIRYNATTNKLEGYTITGWVALN